MSSLSRELVFLILQFLDEEKFKDTVHRWATSIFFSFFHSCFCIYHLLGFKELGNGANIRKRNLGLFLLCCFGLYLSSEFWFNWLYVCEGWRKNQGSSSTWGISRIVWLMVNGMRWRSTYLGLLRLMIIDTRWRSSLRFESKNILRHLTSELFAFVLAYTVEWQ